MKTLIECKRCHNLDEIHFDPPIFSEDIEFMTKNHTCQDCIEALKIIEKNPSSLYVYNQLCPDCHTRLLRYLSEEMKTNYYPVSGTALIITYKKCQCHEPLYAQDFIQHSEKLKNS